MNALRKLGICALLAGTGVSPALGFDQYEIRTFEQIGATGFSAGAINNLGWMAGVSSPAIAPARFVNGQVQNLTLLPGYNVGEAGAISSSGAAAGGCYRRVGEVDVFKAALWTANGTLIDPGIPEFSIATGINDNLQVSINGPGGAQIWENGQSTLLQSLSGATAVFGLNASGVAVGGTLFSGNPHAIRWVNGLATDLHPAGAFDSEAVAINDVGVAAGYVGTPSGLVVPSLWAADGSWTQLPTVGGTFGKVDDVNNNGQAVGRATGTDGLSRAVLWENGQAARFIDLLPAGHGWSFAMGGFSINDNGWIRGRGVFNNEGQDFLMTPVPENSTMFAIGLGILTVILPRRRHR